MHVHIPCTANTDLPALVNDGEVVRLSSNVWEPATVGVVQALESVSNFAKILSHCGVLVCRSWEAIREPAGGEANGPFRLNVVGTSN